MCHTSPHSTAPLVLCVCACVCEIECVYPAAFNPNGLCLASSRPCPQTKFPANTCKAPPHLPLTKKEKDKTTPKPRPGDGEASPLSVSCGGPWPYPPLPTLPLPFPSSPLPFPPPEMTTRPTFISRRKDKTVFVALSSPLGVSARRDGPWLSTIL